MAKPGLNFITSFKIYYSIYMMAPFNGDTFSRALMIMLFLCVLYCYF